MPVNITVSGATQFSARLRLISPKLMEIGRTAVLRLTYDLANAVRKGYDDAGLNVRSGALKASIQSGGVEARSLSITGRTLIGQGLPYAKIHEYGGTITPKNSQYLAIPLDAAKTAAGVARFSPRDIASAGYVGSFVRNHVIFGKNADGTATPLFALKPSVTIPARPYARPAFAKMRPEIERRIGEALHQAVKASEAAGTS